MFVFAMGSFMVACNQDAEGTEGADAAVAVDPAGDAGAVADPSEVVAEAPVGPTTTIDFPETEYDFGMIDQGDVVSHTYMFTNTGTEPLIISNAKGSCGCTIPKWPKDPIAPGETGEMLVEFNSKGKKGNQNKKVTITANTNPAQSFIYLKGNVNAPEGAEGTEPAISVQGQ